MVQVHTPEGKFHLPPYPCVYGILLDFRTSIDHHFCLTVNQLGPQHLIEEILLDSCTPNIETFPQLGVCIPKNEVNKEKMAFTRAQLLEILALRGSRISKAIHPKKRFEQADSPIIVPACNQQKIPTRTQNSSWEMALYFSILFTGCGQHFEPKIAARGAWMLFYLPAFSTEKTCLKNPKDTVDGLSIEMAWNRPHCSCHDCSLVSLGDHWQTHALHFNESQQCQEWTQHLASQVETATERSIETWQRAAMGSLWRWFRSQA